jgi:hypothetical protein
MAKRRSKGLSKHHKYNPQSPKEDSSWWQDWLVPVNKAQHLWTSDEATDSKAKEFSTYFCVPFKIFEDLSEGIF